MYLKKLEIYGFKSFGEKVNLEFSPGISAVIGPNGCGKSNIIDAVRWVLGEQNVRTLRGNRMEEVIFSGSEKRKPLNFAEVSLLFDNADSLLNVDYTQVEITRRLYRSGESEYFINKSPCRLKDINELFTDTGVGTEFYSIVGQNRVEEIINARPEERRELFEEASGVLKYKQRKKDASRKLEEMKQNLQRVDDLLAEMENQAVPLQEQARVAGHYRELVARYREGERKLLGLQLSRSKKHLERCTLKLEQIQEELASVMHQAGQVDLKLEEQQRLERETAREKNYYEQEINTQNREKERLESQQHLLEEKEKNLRHKIVENCTRYQQLEKKIEEIRVNINKWEEEQEKNRLALQEKESEITDLKEKAREYEKDSTLKEVEELQQEMRDISTRKERASSRIEEIEKQYTRLESRKGELSRQIEDEESHLKEIEEKKRELKEKKENLQEKLQQVEEEALQVNKDLEELQHRLEEQRQAILSAQQELSRLENRYWMLEKWREESYRVSEGVSLIWEAKKSQKEPVSGVEDTFFSVVTVPSRYRRALEAALEEKAHAILASDGDAATRALFYLKEEGKGRASFVPLDLEGKISQPGEDYRHNLPSGEKILGTAEEVVQSPSRYRKAVTRLLQGVLIVENFQDAVQVAGDTGYSCTVVTLEGEAVLPGGFFRGGAPPGEEKTALWGGEEEVKELEKQMEEINKTLEEKENQQGKLQQKERKTRESASDLDRQREQLKNEINQVKRQEDTLDAREKHSRETLEQRQNELVFCQQEERDLSARLEEENRDFKEMESREQEASEKLERLQADYRKVMQEKEELQSQLTDLQIRYNSLQEQQGYLEEKLNSSRSELSSAGQEQQRKVEENRKAHGELEEVEKNKELEQEKLGELAERSIASSRNYEEASSRFNEIKAARQEIEKEASRLRERQKKLERQERQKELEKTRLQAEVDHLSSSFTEKFGPAAEETLEGEDRQKDLDEEEIKQELERLKEEIEELGEVNTGSIDELERLNERISFLESQKEDLEKGEESLNEVLSQIDREIKHSFGDALEQIGEYFQSTFAELFGGGYALLKLTDPEDLLESGVEIVARPPGKKLQNISLLSSGEKALTVIALLFSILSYKPAPFYILDEIEASLDDYNLNKFTEFLKKKTREAQFILVTHRKTTTEVADLIYGITMQEYGVTRILSLKTDEKVS